MNTSIKVMSTEHRELLNISKFKKFICKLFGIEPKTFNDFTVSGQTGTAFISLNDVVQDDNRILWHIIKVNNHYVEMKNLENLPYYIEPHEITLMYNAFIETNKP